MTAPAVGRLAAAPLVAALAAGALAIAAAGAPVLARRGDMMAQTVGARRLHLRVRPPDPYL